MAKQKPRQFFAEASAWLKSYRRLKQTDGYQGIVLDVAKALLAKAAEGQRPGEGRASQARPCKMVTDGSKVRSPYQQELGSVAAGYSQAVRPRSGGQHVRRGRGAGRRRRGNARIGTRRWTPISKAIDIAEKTKLKNPGGIAAVREAIGRVQFMIARDLFNKGKLSECIELAGKIVRDDQGNVQDRRARRRPRRRPWAWRRR